MRASETDSPVILQKVCSARRKTHYHFCEFEMHFFSSKHFSNAKKGLRKSEKHLWLLGVVDRPCYRATATNRKYVFHSLKIYALVTRFSPNYVKKFSIQKKGNAHCISTLHLANISKLTLCPFSACSGERLEWRELRDREHEELLQLMELQFHKGSKVFSTLFLRLETHIAEVSQT